MKVTIVLPPVSKDLHAHNTGHWRKKSKQIKQLRQLAYFLTRQETREHWEAARVTYRFFFPDLRERDEANCIQSQKAAIDGVVDAKLIPKDDWRRLFTAGVVCELDRNNPRVELEFEKAEPKEVKK